MAVPLLAEFHAEARNLAGANFLGQRVTAIRRLTRIRKRMGFMLDDGDIAEEIQSRRLVA
jgi:hypothetical protein